MKNKIIYLLILIFSAGLLITARKNNKVTGNEGVCTSSNAEGCCESKKIRTQKSSDFDLTPFGISFFNI